MDPKAFGELMRKISREKSVEFGELSISHLIWEYEDKSDPLTEKQAHEIGAFRKRCRNKSRIKRYEISEEEALNFAASAINILSLSQRDEIDPKNELANKAYSKINDMIVKEMRIRHEKEGAEIDAFAGVAQMFKGIA